MKQKNEVNFGMVNLRVSREMSTKHQARPKQLLEAKGRYPLQRPKQLLETKGRYSLQRPKQILDARGRYSLHRKSPIVTMVSLCVKT